MSEFGAIKKRVRNSALNELEQARAELHNGGRSKNQRKRIMNKTWQQKKTAAFFYNFFVFCIDTK